MLRPGAYEHKIVARAQQLLFEMGSEQVEAINAVSGDRCNPHPHVFSDRLLRPGDQAFFDVIHSFMGYRTCYYRTFNVGGISQSQLDAYKQCREWLDAAIDLVRPGTTTDEIAAVWPTAEELGFPSEEALLRPAVRPRRRRRALRAADDLPRPLLRLPGRDRGRHGLRARDLLRRHRRRTRPHGSRRRSSSPRPATAVLTRFPAEELLVAGKTYVRGADLLARDRNAAV